MTEKELESKETNPAAAVEWARHHLQVAMKTQSEQPSQTNKRQVKYWHNVYKATLGNYRALQQKLTDVLRQTGHIPPEADDNTNAIR